MVNCRVCLENPQSPESLALDQKKKFFQITGVELDEMSDEFLCKKCMKLLLVSWEFRIGALNADDWFRKQKDQRLDEEDSSHEVKCEILVDETVIVEGIPLPLKEDIKPPEDEMFICYLCNAEFNTYRKIRDHIRKHRKELGRFCRFCDEVFPNRTKMSLHEKKHRKKRPLSIMCEQCGKSFSEFRKLRLHKRTHEQPYKCTITGCTEAFTQKTAFHKHLVTKHGNKPLVCTDCGNNFSNHQSLKSHRRLFHNDGLNVACPECTKMCLNPKALEQHVASKHRGERNYGCQVCSNKYLSAVNLRRHYHDSHYEVYLELVKSKVCWERMRKSPV